MATTKYKIAETVQRRLSGGTVKLAAKWTIRDLIAAVEQVGNKALKMDHFQSDLPLGNVIPSGASVATYENILVTKYKNVSESLLPAMPLKLPRGLGVYQIFPPDDVNNQYIPIDNSAEFLINSQPVLSELSGCTGYTQYGTRVQYTRDLTLPNEAVYVTMRLLVLDLSQYGDWDVLPLPADMEADVVNQVFNMFAQTPVAQRIDDPGRAEQVGTPVNQQTQR